MGFSAVILLRRNIPRARPLLHQKLQLRCNMRSGLLWLIGIPIPIILIIALLTGHL